MFRADELSAMIRDVFFVHSIFPKTPDKAFRKFDGSTPYGVHPVLAAMFFLHEETLPEDFRVIGAKALLAHDILEDTTAILPDWCCDDKVCSLIKELTFSEQQDPSVEIWGRSSEAILLKFYDVTINLMCVGKMDAEKIKRRRQQALIHLAWIRSKHPCLEIVKIAEGLLQPRLFVCQSKL